MKKLYLVLTFLFLLSNSLLFSQKTIKEYEHPSIISFETMPAAVSGDKTSSLSLSDEHFKHLSHSLKWAWNANSAYWSIKQDIGYIPLKKKNDAFVSTFVFWVYAEKPFPEQKLKVEFLRNDSVKCWFDYNLDFTGWRGAWVAFNRDMQGTPVAGMNAVRFSAPGVKNGTLFFDHVMLSSMQDVRQHTADFQAPYVNAKSENHWLILYKSWKKEFDLPLNTTVSASEKEGAESVQNRLVEMLLEGRRPKPTTDLKKMFDQYRISTNADGSVKGLPVFFERYGETYEYLGADRYNKIYDNPMGLRVAGQTLWQLAIAYNYAKNEKDRNVFAGMFTLLTKHLLDQGFQAGSGMGTLHHLGYSMRDFYPSMLLMEKPLKEAGLKNTVQQAMEWFAGTGEVKTFEKEREMDIDAFNTNLIARLSSILMIDNVPEKVRYLHAFSRWVDNGYNYAPGTQGSFKPDGSIYHHRHNYPAYAVGGLSGAVEAVYLLRGTEFKISPSSHEILKNALLAMRFYCNLRTWPLSLSGRHPDGQGQLNPEHFGRLALAGTPDGKAEIDPELGGAYLRLMEKETIIAKKIKEARLKPENSPIGNRTFPYSCLNVHRRDNWMVAAMGHSRYLWATETYRGENMYGRYLNHGALQILATGNPISNEGSGFRQEGWDWNHFPGTTATVLPMKELRARIKNLDQFSGFEEMLLSDEAFAGGISLQSKQGAFGMKLHEHDKYNGSLRARKSVFFFDNRVVALGSDIESALPQPTQTTLFQVYLDVMNKPFYVNGKEVTEFPYKETLTEDKTVISDGLNNYFFVKNGTVEFTKSIQQSLHEETEKPTSNDFALAAINHGGNLKNGRYEYMVLVQPSDKELKQALKEKEVPYLVLQQDFTAHVVRDKKTSVTGYVLFEAGKTENNACVKEWDTPCLIMTDESAPDKMLVSVADPDLRFYEGKSDEQLDEKGKRIERSVYARHWVKNPSKDSEIKITIKGKWNLIKPNENVKVENSTVDTTTFLIKCSNNTHPSGVFFELKRN